MYVALSRRHMGILYAYRTPPGEILDAYNHPLRSSNMYGISLSPAAVNTTKGQNVPLMNLETC